MAYIHTLSMRCATCTGTGTRERGYAPHLHGRNARGQGPASAGMHPPAREKEPVSADMHPTCTGTMCGPASAVMQHTCHPQHHTSLSAIREVRECGYAIYTPSVKESEKLAAVSGSLAFSSNYPFARQTKSRVRKRQKMHVCMMSQPFASSSKISGS